MTVMRKPAGEARERPRSTHGIEGHARAEGPEVVRKGVGPAPVFDAGTRQVAPAGDAPKGMISNPWVRFWSGTGPAPTTHSAVGAAPAAHAQTKGAGEGRGERSEGGERKKSPGRRRKGHDANS